MNQMTNTKHVGPEAGLHGNSTSKTRKCPRCGQIMKTNRDYCIYCGAPLK